MTINKFLSELAKTERKWGLTPNGKIRFYGNVFRCPVIVVCENLGHGYSPSRTDVWMCGVKIGLRENVVTSIAGAADYPFVLHHKAMRKKLLIACGLWRRCNNVQTI